MNQTVYNVLNKVFKMKPLEEKKGIYDQETNRKVTAMSRSKRTGKSKIKRDFETEKLLRDVAELKFMIKDLQRDIDEVNYKMRKERTMENMELTGKIHSFMKRVDECTEIIKDRNLH
ncbi:hypothetical protein AAXE64_26950 [Priestia megaterium]